MKITRITSAATTRCTALSLGITGILSGAAQASQPYGFGPVLTYDHHTQLPEQIDRVGDFNNDGFADVAAFWRTSFANGLNGDVYVHLNDKSGGFLPRQKWHEFFAPNAEIPLIGDFDGDGIDDISTFVRGTSGDVWIALSTSSTFGNSQRWHTDFCFGSEIPVVADINGDGRDDIMTFTRGTDKRVFVALSTGSGFAGTGSLWHGDFCPGEALPFADDVNGDGRDDIICFNRHSQSGSAAGDVMVALSTGNSFGQSQKWHDWFSIVNETPLVGDIDGDGCADIVACTGGSAADVYVALSTGSNFGPGQLWHREFADGSKIPAIGRFNGDLNNDLLSSRGTTGFGQYEVILTGGHAVPRSPEEGEFGFGTMGVPWALAPLDSRPALTEIPVIVALVEIPGRPSFASAGRDSSYFDRLIFGPTHPNVRSYFQEMSGGKFAFRRFTVMGPIQLNPSDYPNGDYRRSLKQELANRGVNFRGFDTDGNGLIENKELVILMIDNATDAGGYTAGSQEIINDASGPLTVGNAISAAGFKGVIDLYAHELAHTLGVYDMYSSNCYGQDATLMHCNATTTNTSLIHLDPFHKMRLGWATPRVYDVRYPGGTKVSVAQTTALGGRQKPLLLQDPARDPREFYMVDLRNPNWNGGTQTTGGGPASGYDADVADHGFGMWYYNINAANQFVVRHAFIHPGSNNVPNSSVPPGSDDIAAGQFIGPGPDGIVQSQPSGDDVYRDDAMAYLSVTPSDIGSRKSTTFYDQFDGFVEPEWFDHSPVAGGVKMRFDKGASTSGGGYVQWGAEFVPFLTKPVASTVKAGRSLLIEGNLGIRDPGTMTPVLVNRDHSYDLVVGVWTDSTAVVVVPVEARAGDYRLLIYADEDRQLESNSLAITIENPYWPWADIELDDVQQTNPDLALPFADADKDGWPNIGEFLMGSDPADGGSHPDLSPEIVPGQGIVVRWPEVNGRSSFVSVQPEKSTNLIDWQEMPDVFGATGNPISTFGVLLDDGNSRGFVRLVFELE